MFYKHLHDPSCDLFMHGEEAPQSKEAQLQAALDAEREKVAFLEKKNANLVEASNLVLKVKADQDEQLATLQAQLEQAVEEKETLQRALTKQIDATRHVVTDLTTLRQLVEAIPIYNGRLDIGGTSPQWLHNIVQYRATMDAQDAGKETDNGV